MSGKREKPQDPVIIQPGFVIARPDRHHHAPVSGSATGSLGRRIGC
jgi:hypothetical protein